MFFAKNVRDRKDTPSEDYYVRLCSGNPYIINLEAEVLVGPARWMVLELHTPLMSDKEEFDKNFGQDGERSNSFSRDLIEGVKFLHSRRIAHLDIKPDNLVFDSKKNRLVLIDFDVAFSWRWINGRYGFGIQHSTADTPTNEPCITCTGAAYLR